MNHEPHRSHEDVPPPGAPHDDCTGLLEQLAAASLVAEAEDLTRGVRHLSIATGDPETEDELARINTLTAAAWTSRPGAATTSIRGGGDYLTVRVEGPDADGFVDDLAELARRLNPGFWRITRAAHPF